MNFNINRESHFSLLPLSSLLVELEFRGVDICRGSKTIEPGEKPLEQCKNNQQTQPTYGLGWELNLAKGNALATAPTLLPKNNVTHTLISFTVKGVFL